MIFVTGGAGFIGSNFVHFIKDKIDEEIVIIDKMTYAADIINLYPLRFNRSKTGREKGNITHEMVDLSDYEEVKRLFKQYKPSAVFHFAAESHVDNSIKDVTPFLATNIIGTTNLLRCSVDYPVDIFHHISTDEVYGALGECDTPFTERTAYDPQNPYSASKASSDHFVMAYKNTFDLPVKITNCSNNYGPRQNKEKLIPKTIDNIINNKKIPVYGCGENIRDWIYVEDHCEAIYEVYKRGKVGEKYNIGGECEIKNIDLVYKLIDMLGGSKDLIEYVDDRPGHDLRYAINNAKIASELNWKPKHTLERGLEKTIKWYKNDWT
jgi:dTDP-glucose 4,6-dehydratase